MSEHEVKVIEIDNIQPHENADNLEITNIWGYSCVIRKGQFKIGDLAAFIEPDYCVDIARPEFSFIQSSKQNYRVTIRRFRGVYSYGLLIPAPVGSSNGDNVMELLGVTRWEPQFSVTAEHNRRGSGESVKGPEFPVPKYDLENIRKYNKLITASDNVYYTVKLHGCFQRDARIKTPEGFKEIRQIQPGDIVLGYDHKIKSIIPTTVLNVFRNGKTSNWIKLTSERVKPSYSPQSGNGVISFKITENHKIWSVTKNDYVEIKNCNVGDIVKQAVCETSITTLQKQVLIGKMLGDGSFYKNSTRAGYIQFSHVESDSEYINYCENVLSPIMGSTRQLISGYGSKMVSKKTKSFRQIATCFNDWQKTEKKEVPENLPDIIAPIALAFWYMDDGSLGHSEKQKDRANFAVCDFSDESVKVLQKCLLKFDIQSVFYKSTNNAGKTFHNRIRLNTEDAYKFFHLVGKYIHPSMRRKLPEELRAIPFEQLVDSEKNVQSIETFDVKIQSIESIVEKHNYTKFDIETESHNYFAHDILVHNCNMRAVYHNGKMYCGSRNVWKNAKALGTYFTTPKSIVLKTLIKMMAVIFKTPEKAGKFLNLMAVNCLFFGFPYNWINTIKTRTIYEHDKKNAWQSALEQNPWIETWCRANPDVVVYGELIGPSIQGEKFHYGYVGEQLGFYVFDILENGQWISNSQFDNPRFSGLKFVPVVYYGPFDQEKMESIAEEKETFNGANHIREGLVIKLNKERVDSRLGRVALKYVSNTYFRKSN